MLPFENNGDNWKTKVLVLGAVVGALLGLGSAYLLVRTAEESGGRPPEVGTGDAIKMLIAVIGLVRGIASLGEGKKR
jgi:high-affinity Fe2+/Pb2+ permease